MRSDDVTARLWRTVTDARRVVTRSGSARPALDAVAPTGRRGTADWTRSTAAGHARYRVAVEPVAGAVAAVCVTQRPEHLERIVADIRAQRWTPLQLVVVLNADGFVDAERIVDAADTDVDRVTLLERSEDVTLGACLNAALDVADARFVAKFDDDDRYGPWFLADALRAHRYAGAGIVGKHTYYARLVASGRTLLRFPGHEFTYSGTLAGGTLVIDRERTGSIRFEDRSLGEDRAFIRACHRRGVTTFAADRFNFCQTRAQDNTWRVSDDDFAVGSVDAADDEVFV